MKRFCKTNIFCLIWLVLVFTLSSVGFSMAEEQSGEPVSIEEKIKKLEELLKEVEKKQKALDVVGKLKQTDEEKKKSEDDILDAAGDEYTLASPGILSLSYDISYSGDTYDTFRQTKNDKDQTVTEIDHANSHDITNSIFVKYPLKKNITVSVNFPFVAKFSDKSDRSKQAYGPGDPSVTIQYQPFKPRDSIPTTILSFGMVFPFGTNPYDIDPDDELATGNGNYSMSGGINFSKTIDPIIAYGGLNYYHYFPIKNLSFNPDADQKAQGYYIYQVNRGDSVSANIGMGYALSYVVSISLGYQFSYSFPTNYYWKNAAKNSSSASYSSNLSIGANWKINHKRSINTDLSMGLYNSNSDVSLSVSIPFDFKIR